MRIPLLPHPLTAIFDRSRQLPGLLAPVLSLSLTLALALPLGAARIETTSTVVAAEVYPAAARVTRIAKFEVPAAGPHTVLLDALPNNLVEASLQLDVLQGPAAVRQSYVQRQDAVTSEALDRLDAEIATHMTALSALNHERKQLSASESYFRSIAEATREALKGGSLDALTRAETAWQQYLEVSERAQSESQRLNEAAKTHEAALKALRVERNQLFQRLSALQNTAAVELESSGPGPVELEIRYVVPGASWRPAYTAYAFPEAAEVNLVYEALLTQRTGEDWNNIDISLSSGNPSAGGSPLELEGLYLVDRPYLRRARAEDSSESEVLMLPSFGAGERAQNDDRSVNALPARASVAPVVMHQSTGFAATLPRPVTLQHQAGNRRPTRLPIVEKTLKARFWSQSVPVFDTTAFLMAEVENTFELPLLPGAAQLFVDGKLVGRSAIESVARGESLELGLGENENVRVERETTLQESGTAGMIGRRQEEKRAYRTTVTNRMPVPHEVRIVDRFPIARDEAIKVERQHPRERAADIDEATGVFTWAQTLAPGASEGFRTAYTVTYPENYQLALP